MKDNHINKALQLMRQAEKADEDFNFPHAYSLFVRAAREFDKQDDNQANICLVRAATCLEKSQAWHGHSALWEFFGNRLGNLIDPEYKFTNPDKPGQSGMFHIISWQDWINPEANYYNNNIEAKLHHQQAWAYMWGAEEAEAAHRYSRAGKLFRKAAISWELSKWGELEPDPSNTSWTKKRWRKSHGEKWKLAARCYFQAIYNIIQSRGKNPKELYISSQYEPHNVEWGL